MNVTLVVDDAGLDKVEDFLSRVDIFGVDFETNIEKFYQARKARTLQCGDRNEQYVIDLLGLCNWNSQLLKDLQGDYGARIPGSRLERVVNIFRRVIDAKTHLKVGQNLSFEYNVFWWSFGIRMWNMYSVDVAEKLLLLGLVNPFAAGHFALDDLCVKYLWKQIDKSEQKGFDLEKPLTPKQVAYAGLDTRLPLAIRGAQIPKLQKNGLELAAEIRMNSIGAFEDLHINGFYLNREAWMNLVNDNKETHRKNLENLDAHFIPLVGRKGELAVDLDELEEKWRNTPNKTAEDKKLRADRRKDYMDARRSLTENKKALTTYEGEAAINYGSNDQILEALLKIKGLNKTTLPSTDDQILKKLAGEKFEDGSVRFPVIDGVREFRTSQKKLTTYGEEWLVNINDITKRVHSRFNQTGAETGRSSSTKPNLQNLPKEPEVRACFQARPGYKMLTVDMNGAELRIIAELAIAKSWIEAFRNNWDVHSVGAEILYPVEWPAEACKGGETYFDKDKNKEIILPPCAYYLPDGNGGYKRQKCKCPAHQERRNGNKSTNFLLAYGGGPKKLGEEIGKTTDEAIDLMSLHRSKFPDVWDYLEKSGKHATLNMEARTMSGLRRLFTRPTWELATKKCIEQRAKEKKPGLPTSQEVSKKMRSMFGAIEREGKNTPIQGSNADIANVAMGAGFDQNGKPFLWHILWPKYKAILVNFVHDEFVVECPEETAEECFHEIGDAIRRAGAMFFKYITMEYDGHWNETVWKK